jgi:hypothetical protein
LKFLMNSYSLLHQSLYREMLKNLKFHDVSVHI